VQSSRDTTERTSNTRKIKYSCTHVLTEHHAMNAYWRNGGIVPRILDLGTRWRWGVSFTSRPLYPQGNADIFEDQTSRKPMTQLKEKFFIIFCLNLVYLRS
jgi:hypothetical protein